MTACSSAQVAIPLDSPARDGQFDLPQPWILDSGHHLDPARLAWRLTGHAQGPLLVVLGGISAHRHVADAESEHRGWWSAIARPGGALDLDRYQLLSIDYLGGGDSSRPHCPDEFAVTPADQARALAALLDHLGIVAPISLIGASYGGMVALAFVQHFPDRSRRALVLCAAHRGSATTGGYRSLQRAIVRLALDNGQSRRGVALARSLAMLGFRSRQELDGRFSPHGQLIGQRLELPVEGYLHARGEAYARITDAASFLCLSQSCDLQQLDPAKLTAPLWLVAFDSDAIIPAGDIAELAAVAPRVERHVTINSPYGHDGFLKEVEAVGDIVAAFAAEVQR